MFEMNKYFNTIKKIFFYFKNTLSDITMENFNEKLSKPIFVRKFSDIFFLINEHFSFIY